jgi:hypothetical protein
LAAVAPFSVKGYGWFFVSRPAIIKIFMDNWPIPRFWLLASRPRILPPKPEVLKSHISRLTILLVFVNYISIVSIWMIIGTAYPTTPYVVIYSVAVRNLKFYLIPFLKMEFLSIKNNLETGLFVMGRRFNNDNASVRGFFLMFCATISAQDRQAPVTRRASGFDRNQLPFVLRSLSDKPQTYIFSEEVPFPGERARELFRIIDSAKREKSTERQTGRENHVYKEQCF